MMLMLNYPIAIGLSPNTEKSDFRLALKVILLPFLWLDGNLIKQVEEWFKNKFDVNCAKSYNSGRSAYYSLLKAFEIRDGDEVIIQPFTCVAVVDPILWVGAKPVYADIDERLNIDPFKIEKVISKRTRAIVVQHTFGIPASIDRIATICEKHGILLIEDCANSLGAEYNNKPLGTFGDASFFSFGRDKVISSVFGGMAIINRQNQEAINRLEKIYKELAMPSYFWTFIQLLHPIFFTVILPLYDILIGKIILALCLKLRLINKPVAEMEKRGIKPSNFPEKYPNALAQLLLLQLEKLEKYNSNRRENAEYYYEHLAGLKNLVLPEKVDGSIYLRFNILTDKADLLLKTAKRKKILLGNWYRNLIDPYPVDYKIMNYKQNNCPKAQRLATMSVNLPTYPRINNKNLETICNLIKSVCI